MSMNPIYKMVWAIVLFGLFGCLNILLSIPAIQKYNKLVVVLETAVKVAVLLMGLLASIVTIDFLTQY